MPVRSPPALDQSAYRVHHAPYVRHAHHGMVCIRRMDNIGTTPVVAYGEYQTAACRAVRDGLPEVNDFRYLEENALRR